MIRFRPKLSVFVSATVTLGVLAASSGRVHAGEAIPAALKGFQGMMSGKLTKKGETMIAFKISKIMKKWKGNKAENPGAAVGETIVLTLKDISAHHRERLMKNYRGLKVGDDIELEAFDLGGKYLAVKEWLKKVGAEGD